MKPKPTINHRGWLAVWLQKRRRARHARSLWEPTPVPVTLNTGLTGYWKLDEAEYEVRADATPHGWDLWEEDPWGNGDPVVYQTSGLIGNAATFEEWSGWCLVNHVLPVFVTGDFTVSGWLRLTPGSYGAQGICCVGGTLNLSVLPDQGKLYFDGYTGGGHAYFETPTDSVLEDVWTQITLVKAGDQVTLYVNGDTSGGGVLPGALVPQAGGHFAAGDWALGVQPGGYPLVSGLDEVGLWQRALSAAEVGQLYNYGDGLAYEMF